MQLTLETGEVLEINENADHDFINIENGCPIRVDTIRKIDLWNWISIWCEPIPNCDVICHHDLWNVP